MGARRAAELRTECIDVERALVLERRRAAAFLACGPAPAAEQRVSDGAGTVSEEDSLLAGIADIESLIAGATPELETCRARLAERQERLARHQRLVQGLDQVAAAARARDLEAEVGAFAAALRRGLEGLPAARAAAAARAATARLKLARFLSVRQALNRLEERISARLEEVTRRLSPGRPGSLVDERMYTAAQAIHVANGGRAAIGIGVLFLAGGILGAMLFGLRLVSLQIPPLAGDMASRHLPSHLPHAGGFLVLAGLLLILLGRVRQLRGRRNAEALRREADAISRQIAGFEDERRLLGEDDGLALLTRGRLGELKDPDLKKLAAEIARDHAADLADAASLEQDGRQLDDAVRVEEDRLRELAALEEGANRALLAAVRCRQMLRRLVRGGGRGVADVAPIGEGARRECPGGGRPLPRRRAVPDATCGTRDRGRRGRGRDLARRLGGGVAPERPARSSSLSERPSPLLPLIGEFTQAPEDRERRGSSRRWSLPPSADWPPLGSRTQSVSSSPPPRGA
jgi:hypothetical protein